MVKKPRVCVVGSSNVDLTFRTSRLPRPGETLTGQAFQLGYGGKGANQAVMAARLGAYVTMISRVGHDAFGEGTLRNFQELGIDIAYVGQDELRPTGVAAIMVDDDAQNCIIVIPGANAGLSSPHIHEAAEAIRAADLLLCQLEVPVETVLEAFRIARAAGVQTILNPAPARSLPDELLKLTDLCVPNETELELLADQRVETLEETKSAARRLLSQGPATVIVTIGARGAMVVQPTGTEQIRGFAVHAEDTTGAGDAFIGSLAVFLAEELPLLDAVNRANAAAALSVTRPRTQASFPTRAEVEAFLAGG